MALELSQETLTGDAVKRLVARYCEYDTEIPLKRRLCLLSDEFKVSEKKVHSVLVFFLGREYYVEPFKEYKYW